MYKFNKLFNNLFIYQNIFTIKNNLRFKFEIKKK